MKSLFFLAIALFSVIFLISISPVLALTVEQGKNYDKEFLGLTPEGKASFKWTSQPERILDDSWKYKDFLSYETSRLISFESSRVSMEFYKDTCDFKLYKAGRIVSDPVIDSFSHALSVDGLPINLGPCNVSAVNQNERGISFNATRLYFTTMYKLDYAAGLEWTHIINNELGKNIDVLISDTCLDCRALKVDGNLIRFENYILDTKNEIHNTVSAARKLNDNFVIDYMATLNNREKLIIDPSFSNDAVFNDGHVTDNDNDDICETSPAAVVLNNGSTTAQVGLSQTSQSSDCKRAFFSWDISSIPTGSTVTDSDFFFEVNSIVGAGADNCDFISIGTNPNTRTGAQIWDDITAGTTIISNNTICDTVAQTSIDLSGSGDDEIESQLSSGFFALAVIRTGDAGTALDATQRSSKLSTTEAGAGTIEPEIQIEYFTEVLPSGVNPLTLIEATFSTLEIEWNTPFEGDGTITGYQVNYSDPQSENPNTSFDNDTESLDTSIIITGLDLGTDYSIRVSAWTEFGNNITGADILNVTTLGSVGSFSVNSTNPDIVPIRFQRNDINDTQTNVNVIFDNTFDPFDCILDFGNAQSNIEYNNLDSLVYDSDFNYSTFQIINSTNDVITFECFDVATNESGKYVLTLSGGSIPLIDQVQGFQGGEYGTSGDFGALDLVTLLIVIVSMVGLNRVNQTAGVIISFMVMFGLAAFELIEIPTLLFGSIAVIIMLVVSSTRKP